MRLETYFVHDDTSSVLQVCSDRPEHRKSIDQNPVLLTHSPPPTPIHNPTHTSGNTKKCVTKIYTKELHNTTAQT